ncbi:hypothetical protein GIB67_037438, partial [Kingdonia uniflora]
MIFYKSALLSKYLLFQKSLSTTSDLAACLPTSFPRLNHLHMDIGPSKIHLYVITSFLKCYSSLTLLAIYFNV